MDLDMMAAMEFLKLHRINFEGFEPAETTRRARALRAVSRMPTDKLERLARSVTLPQWTISNSA